MVVETTTAVAADVLAVEILSPARNSFAPLTASSTVFVAHCVLATTAADSGVVLRTNFPLALVCRVEKTSSGTNVPTTLYTTKEVVFAADTMVARAGIVLDKNVPVVEESVDTANRSPTLNT